MVGERHGPLLLLPCSPAGMLPAAGALLSLAAVFTRVGAGVVTVTVAVALLLVGVGGDGTGLAQGLPVGEGSGVVPFR